MFVSIRDIVFAKGRVALVASVVALITVLLVMLSGLTSGLGRQSTSALQTLDAQRVVLAPARKAKDDPTITTSQITKDQLRAWQEDPAVAHADPLVVTQNQVGSDSQVAAAGIMGLPTDSTFLQQLTTVNGTNRPQDGHAVLSQTLAADLGVSTGDHVSVSGTRLTVDGIVADEFYSHLPVAWLSQPDALALAHQSPATAATEILVDFTDSSHADDASARLDGDAGTQSHTTREAFQAIGSYSSEHGSLTMMQGFLYVISALVVVSFITVWTVQRTRDIAVLRALGASRGYLIRDSLVQAALVVGLGALTGAAVGALAGWLLITQVPGVPFLFSAAGVVLPAAGVLLLGVVGSLLAVRRVAGVDPMIALGGN